MVQFNYNNGMLIQGDCLEVIDKMIKQGVKVDAIITDPPYNIAKDNNFTTMGRAGIDFGEWDKDADLTTWISKAKNLVNKNGSVFVFTGWQQLSYINETLINNGFEVKDLVRFIKDNPMPRNRDRRYIVDFEVAIWAVNKNAKWCFNRQSDKYDRPEYRCGIEPKHVHPTQKPLKLMEAIIKTHTNENDVVFDPFMGSGTTGVACKNLNRKFIGIELDEKYFNSAKERIVND